jgi:hypothetical protein
MLGDHFLLSICVSWSGVELFTLASFSGLGPCTERKVVDIVPLLETARRSLCMRFCILLFCWIVISCTFIPYLSIFNLSMHKIRCLVNFKTVSVSLLMLTVSIMYIFVILNELHPFVLYLYSQHKLLYTILD